MVLTPPFGAVVYRENGEDREVAMVADKGLTYLTGVNKHSTYIVRWNSSKSCQLNIGALNVDSREQLTCLRSKYEVRHFLTI